MVPCVNSCRAAPLRPVLVRVPSATPTEPMPSITSPMWLTLEYAMSRFRSVCRMVTTAPYRTLMTPRATSTQANSHDWAGNSPTFMRSSP